MSQRMQVLFEDSELRRMRAVARAQGKTLAEWVRGALRRALSEEPEGRIEEKLSRVRAASRYQFPTADIDVMLAEIERGYASDE